MVPETSSPRGHGLLDRDVVAAIGASHLRALPDTLTSELTDGAHRRKVAGGVTVHREGESAPHLELVVSGLVRVYVTALDGRTMTVRYCRRGALLGVMSLFASSFELPVSIQAVTDADLLGLRPAVVADAGERDVRVSRALIDELSERVLTFVAEIAGSAFATVEQRVARHLLDLASEGQSGPELVAAVNQQALADAVGTVREVVVRALRELRERDVVRTGRDGIVLLDAPRLAELAYPTSTVSRPPVWNKGH